MILSKPLIEYFPQGFTPRPHQVKGLLDIEAAINKGTKFIIVQAPTGSGKSFISKTLSNITNECESDYRNLVFNYHAFDEDYDGAMQKFKPHGLFALTTTKESVFVTVISRFIVVSNHSVMRGSYSSLFISNNLKKL